MMLHTIKRFLLFCCIFLFLNAQESTLIWNLSNGQDPPKVIAKFTGQLQHSVFYDSNQVLGSSDDFFLFFPKAKMLDVFGYNINNKSQCNMSMLETVFGMEITTPQVFGAYPLGYLEFDALGDQIPKEAQSLINRFRFLRAYLSLTWENNLTLLLGQTMHPMRLAHINCFPRVLDRNHGAPIAVHETFQPQLRITKQWEHAVLMGTLISQMAEFSDGPIGFSSTYLRNDIAPMMHGQFYVEYDNFKGGFGIDYKRIAPRIVTNKDIKVHEKLNSVSTLAFAKMHIQPVIMRTATIFAQNCTDTSLLGGYGVSRICPNTDEREYVNLRAISSWVDISLRKKVEPGIFVGITKNIGATKPIIQTTTNCSTGQEENLIYGIGNNIDKVVRVAPRVYWHISSLTLGAEFEYTRAWYGTIGQKGRVINASPVGNFRLQLGSFYYF